MLSTIALLIAGEDMELDDGEVPPPPPPPLPEGGPPGPAPPPPDYDYAQGYNSYGAQMYDPYNSLCILDCHTSICVPACPLAWASSIAGTASSYMQLACVQARVSRKSCDQTMRPHNRDSESQLLSKGVPRRLNTKSTHITPEAFHGSLSISCACWSFAQCTNVTMNASLSDWHKFARLGQCISVLVLGSCRNGDPASYEAYVASNVQYQASTDSEYQALLSQRQQMQDPEAAAAMVSLLEALLMYIYICS